MKLRHLRPKASGGGHGDGRRVQPGQARDNRARQPQRNRVRRCLGGWAITHGQPGEAAEVFSAPVLVTGMPLSST